MIKKKEIMEAPLLKANYQPHTPVYSVRKPDIASGATYFFESGSGLIYEVTFGKKKSDYLANIINFSVISDDFEDEYSVTNKGEVWRIINTMIEVIRIYHENHPHSKSYEFSGEYKTGEDAKDPSIRTRLFMRAIDRNVDLRYWNILKKQNKIILQRKKYE